MDDNLEKKFKEKSIESAILDFLDLFAKVDFNYAFTGGIAVGAHVGHFVRRHTDVDIITDKESYSYLKEFLEKNNFLETTKNLLIKEFSRKNTYFDIDIFIDNLYLANSPDWQILAHQSLSDDLNKCMQGEIMSIDKLRKTKIKVVPREYVFKMKLMPPVEVSNLHDMLYLIVTAPDQNSFVSAVKNIINNDKIYTEYFQRRLRSYLLILPNSVWFSNASLPIKNKIKKFWRNILV